MSKDREGFLMAISKTLYNRLGGQATLENVQKIFYNIAFQDPWLAPYFTDKPQQLLEDQQTDFMSFLMGGPNRYTGKTPRAAHQHMVIRDELFEHRQKLLSQALKQAGIADDMAIEWLEADATLKRSIVKESAADCKQAYPTQQILDYPKPGS